MKFIETPLEGVMVLEVEPLIDERGFFARTWCSQEFEEKNLNIQIAQCSISFNKEEGTLRGMHYQDSPHAETKVVRCTRGAAYDVVLDLRKNSESYLSWYGIELTEENHKSVYVPEGCAHGFLTLCENTELLYQISTFYRPDSVRGVRWDDSAFEIEWPAKVKVISGRDQNYPDYKP
jgi:dTDP-4-dehydrorhamnose 3,5-epimerase